MGYRLQINKIENKHKFYGTKLFGYAESEDLKSWNWLVENKYIGKDAYFGYGASRDIIMYVKDFREFIKLYNEDFNEYEESEDNYVLNSPEIKEMLELDDYDEVLVRWM